MALPISIAKFSLTDTAVNLPSIPCSKALLQADKDNTGIVFFGTGSNQVHTLRAEDSIVVECSNLADWKAYSDANGHTDHLCITPYYT